MSVLARSALPVSTSRQPLSRGRTRLGLGLAKLGVGLVLLFLVLPLVVVVPMSFSSALSLQFPPPAFSLQYYRNFFSSDAWMSASVNSILVALFSTALAVVLGTCAALALRYQVKRFHALYRSYLLLPLVTPVIVVAVSVYRTYLGWDLANTVVGLTVAHACLTMPYVLLAVTASLSDFDDRLRQAALSLGSTPVNTFREVVLPHIRGGMIAGGFLSAVYSFNEAIVAIFLVASDGQTLPKVMWDGLILAVDPTISVVATVMTMLTAAVVLLQMYVQRRSARQLAAPVEDTE